MSLHHTTHGGYPGFRYGAEGKVHIYAEGNISSREAARQKALSEGGSKKGKTQHFSFTAKLQHMADAEIVEMLSPGVLASIRLRDPSPLLKVFSVGHEGEAQGTISGVGKAAIQYLRDFIGKLHDKIKGGTKLFQGHTSPSNDHTGREVLGTVVGKKLKTIKDQLHTLVAVHIHPEHKNKELDIASIEADVTYSMSQGVVKLDSIDAITGIALSSSQVDTPGFPGATLLGAFQAFKEKLTHTGDEKMTLEEVQALIKEGAYSPSQLFSKEALVADSVVAKHVDASKQTEYEHARRVEKRLGESRQSHESEVKELNERLETLTAQGIKGQARPALDSLIGDRKLTDIQKAYVDKHYDGFKSTAKDEAGLKTDLTTFLDKQLSNLDDVSKLLNVNQEKPGEKEEEKESQHSNSPDASNPDKNPMIPGGKAAEAAGN